MRIRVVKRVEISEGIPCYASEALACIPGVIKTEDGWCRGRSLDDGLVLVLDSKEIGLKGAFLSSKKLASSGYYNLDHIRSIVTKHIRGRSKQKTQELIDSLVSDLQAYNTK